MNREKFIGISLIAASLVMAVLLAFIKVNADEQAAFLCENFHVNQLDMSECPAHKKDSSWLITVSFSLSLLVLVAGIYMLVSGGQPKKSGLSLSPAELPKGVAESLSAEEKAAYGVLKENNGSAYQSDIIKKTGYSKIKVTRILDRMESKGIVERKRRGMANMVVLK